MICYEKACLSGVGGACDGPKHCAAGLVCSGTDETPGRCHKKITHQSKGAKVSKGVKGSTGAKGQKGAQGRRGAKVQRRHEGVI